MAEVTWLDTILREVPRQGTVAWLTRLSDPSNATLSGLAPTVADRSDAGGRSGPELDRFFARRSLLRHLTARRLGVSPETVVVRYGAYGRPTIAVPDGLFCSVAARRDLVGLALSPTPVGLDFEPLEPGPVPWPMLTDAEADHVRALPEAERLPRFLALWTVKEAYVKAAGPGLNIDPAMVDVGSQGGPFAIMDRGRHVHVAAIEHRRTVVGHTEIMAACVAFAAEGTEAT